MRLATIVGGARSGKSAFALSWALAQAGHRTFVATAEAFDEEMRSRIAAHVSQRGESFSTLEAPVELESALAELRSDVVVIDCATLWLSNLLLAGASDQEIQARVRELCVVLRRAPFATIVVSNEVGMGIVPEHELGRRFRDLAGRAHQVLAAASDELYLAAIGCVLRLRPAPIEVVAP